MVALVNVAVVRAVWKLLLVFAVCTSLQGLTRAAEEIEALRASDPPRIDGLLDDQIWKESPQVTQLIQTEPVLGDPISEPTEVWLALDDRNLYIASVSGRMTGSRSFSTPFWTAETPTGSRLAPGDQSEMLS